MAEASIKLKVVSGDVWKLATVGGESDCTCPVCFASVSVGNMGAHTDWHDNLADFLVALSGGVRE